MSNKQILVNLGEDTLQPGSKPAQDQADSRQYDSLKNPQGRTDGNFGYGGSATTDGNPGQTRPREEMQHVAKGADVQKRNDRSHWDDIQASPRFNPLTKHALSQMSQSGRPVSGEPERSSDKDTGYAYHSIELAKREAARQSAERLDAAKSALSGKGNYGDTSATDEPRKLRSDVPLTRSGY
jgi:hypothetical protein